MLVGTCVFPLAARAAASTPMVVVSPAPGSMTASPATQISFLGASPKDLQQLSVVGSMSGTHQGRLEEFSTKTGASFLPRTPFESGETVTVSTTLSIVGAPSGVFQFQVADVIKPRQQKGKPPPQLTDLAGVNHFSSAPGLEAPTISLTASDRTPQGGDFFLSPKGVVGLAGPMIVSPSGQLVWFHPLSPGTEAFDLNVQRYEGKPVLTWFQGKVIDGHGEGVDIIESSSYKRLAVVRAGNGLSADLHEFVLTRHGTAYITAYRLIRWNLPSATDGDVGDVFDSVIQEIDIKTGLVMYEWDSLDHVPVSDSDLKVLHPATAQFDYFHVNSVEVLSNSDLLVSARNTSALYEVDPAEEGAVIWQLGGLDSTFSRGTGTTFWFQHDARTANGELITVFDDGGLPRHEPRSRALVLRLDSATGSVSLVHAYTHPGTTAAATALGSVQLRPGGDLIVGWGTSPFFSEFNSSGKLLYDARLPSGDDTYRVYRYVWYGHPTTTPSLALHPTQAGFTLDASWNGATEVKSWSVLVGSSTSTLQPLEQVQDTGFETAISLPLGAGVVEVEALSSNGKALGRSAPLAL